jgi:hypothetical protein
VDLAGCLDGAGFVLLKPGIKLKNPLKASTMPKIISLCDEELRPLFFKW